MAPPNIIMQYFKVLAYMVWTFKRFHPSIHDPIISADPFIHLFTHSFIHLFIHPSIQLFIHSLISLCDYTFLHLLFSYSYINLSMHSLVLLFKHLLSLLSFCFHSCRKLPRHVFPGVIRDLKSSFCWSVYCSKSSGVLL